MIGFDVTYEQLKAISDLGAHLGIELEFDHEPLEDKDLEDSGDISGQ